MNFKYQLCDEVADKPLNLNLQLAKVELLNVSIKHNLRQSM